MATKRWQASNATTTESFSEEECNLSENIFRPGPDPGTVRNSEGEVLSPPAGWCLLPPGDAALTRRVKAAGEYWIVQEKRGRRAFSRGVWAPAETIEQVRLGLEQERSTEAYAKKQQASVARRAKHQQQYVGEFTTAVREFLNFHPRHASLANQLAEAVAEHATPVGSGTVARTRRIPVEKRAEAAVIAWMRHQTTAYDSLKIPRVKGKRREVRRMLAQRSKELLMQYREGIVNEGPCVLREALR